MAGRRPHCRQSVTAPAWRPFIDRHITDTLAETGLAAHRLELAVTESFALQEYDPTISTVSALKKLGIQIALDDFGTGYSSLGHLRQLPIDNIKLDKSFMKGLPDHDGADAIVRAVSHLGKSFRAVTTAEGVETKDQLDLVRRGGYCQIQGYLVSEPVPASMVPEIMNASLMARRVSKRVDAVAKRVALSCFESLRQSPEALRVNVERNIP